MTKQDFLDKKPFIYDSQKHTIYKFNGFEIYSGIMYTYIVKRITNYSFDAHYNFMGRKVSNTILFSRCKLV